MIEVRGETSVDTEELFVDYGSQWKRIEGVHAAIINIHPVFVAAFELECKVLSQMSTFVISSEQKDVLRIVNFEGEEIDEGFERKVSTIYIVT